MNRQPKAVRRLLLAAGILALGTAVACGLDAKTKAKSDDSVTEVEVDLNWSAAAAGSGVDSYNIYGVKETGSTPNAAASGWKLMGEVNNKTAGFSLVSPQVALKASTYLPLKELVGGDACFMVKAVAGQSESDASSVVCGTL